MPFSYKLSEEAEKDVEEAYSYYEDIRKGLGEEFIESLDQARSAIVKNPTTYRVRYRKKVRCFVVDRFPFLICYVINENSIDVLSVFNTNQNPDKLEQRF